MRIAVLTLPLALISFVALAQKPVEVTGIKVNVPQPPAERLDWNNAKYASELLHDGDIVWIEWLQRKDRGGSYLRTLEHKPISDDKSSYLLSAGTKFVYKAPDQPAHNFVAPGVIAIPKTKDPVAIARAVAGAARILPDPVVQWHGLIAAHWTTYTELTKDWTDGDIYEVDWASGGKMGELGQAYIRIVSGQFTSLIEGAMGFGATYMITAGSVFDIKVPNVGVERLTAKKNFPFSKTHWPALGTVQNFVVEGNSR